MCMSIGDTEWPVTHAEISHIMKERLYVPLRNISHIVGMIMVSSKCLPKLHDNPNALCVIPVYPSVSGDMDIS